MVPQLRELSRSGRSVQTVPRRVRLQRDLPRRLQHRRRVMGSLYRPKFRATDGTLKLQTVWWLKYRDALGVMRRESSKTTKEREAKRLLKQREGAAVEGRVIAPRADRVTVAELLEELRQEYAANQRRSGKRLSFAIQRLAPFFGHQRAVRLASSDVTKYKTQRQAEGVANATINRELAALKRALSLALRAERIQRVPHIAMLEERNVRSGFFERDQFEAVREQLPACLRPVVTFAYVTGWRIPSEVLTLRWRQVDFEAGTVRLEPETTKNREGRTFVLTPELRACLEAQRARTEAFQREHDQIVPWVFHRDGEPIKDFRGAWKVATRYVGLAGRIPH